MQFSQLEMLSAQSNIELRFMRFHNANPAIYELVKRFTLELIHNRHKNGSISMVIERVRWETKVKTSDPPQEFKVSNEYRAHYARLFMRDFPQYKGFFRTRQMAGEVESDRRKRFESPGA